MYIIYTDGGSRGNPGPSGAGAILYDASGVTVAEVSKFLGEQTNNFAEYEAVYLGLVTLKKIVPKAKRKETRVEVRLDSQLIARQLMNEYQIKEEGLFGQYIKVHNLLVAEFPLTIFVHVPREENKEADALANIAMDRG